MFAPEESAIFLYAPPFHTVAAYIEGVKKRFGVDRFWATYAALESISPELALVIGDFGLGPDAPIVLDYRQGAGGTIESFQRSSCAAGALPACAGEVGSS